MKTHVVRARISPELKADAGNVLQGLGLEMSDAIRLFLCQVVRQRGLPFEIREDRVKVVSGKRLWAMKRKGQAQSRQLAASGAIPPETVFMLRGDQVRNAMVDWPDVPLSAAASERKKRDARKG